MQNTNPCLCFQLATPTLAAAFAACQEALQAATLPERTADEQLAHGGRSRSVDPRPTTRPRCSAVAHARTDATFVDAEARAVLAFVEGFVTASVATTLGASTPLAARTTAAVLRATTLHAASAHTDSLEPFATHDLFSLWDPGSPDRC